MRDRSQVSKPTGALTRRVRAGAGCKPAPLSVTRWVQVMHGALVFSGRGGSGGALLLLPFELVRRFVGGLEISPRGGFDDVVAGGFAGELAAFKARADRDLGHAVGARTHGVDAEVSDR